MYVDQDLVSALPAVDRKAPRVGPQIHALHLSIAAKRAHEEPALHCQEYISFRAELQEISTPFPKDKIVTETKNFIKLNTESISLNYTNAQDMKNISCIIKTALIIYICCVSSDFM